MVYEWEFEGRKQWLWGILTSQQRMLKIEIDRELSSVEVENENVFGWRKLLYWEKFSNKKMFNGTFYDIIMGYPILFVSTAKNLI